MLKKDSFKRWYIKFCRYLFRKRYVTVMAGPLKGYQWTTGSSYEYIIGNYEDPDVLHTFCSWLKPTTVFFDLGANVGFYSLLADRFITAGKIYSFEPLPALRAGFEQHIAINKDQMNNTRIKILPFAISDREKEVVFSNNADQQDGNTYISGSAVFERSEDKITVKCFSIDELLLQGYEVPDIIKIDVEGAEYDVLKGAVNTLKKFRPNILLATHDCHLPGVKENCIEFLQALGYNLQHTGGHNKKLSGLDDYIAVHPGKL